MTNKFSSILVTGIIKNVERRINKEVRRIESKLQKYFELVSFELIESDSDDKTLINLDGLKSKKSNFDYQTFGKLSQIIPSRIDRLRYCRNKYVEQIRKIPSSTKPNFVLVVDFDIKNNSLNFEKLFHFVAVTNQNWDAIFCNQSGRYFDVYALRSEGWCDQDCFLEAKKLAISIGWEKARDVAIWTKMKKINQNSHQLIKVTSAFGGMALYKTEVFQRFNYELCDGVHPSESEHISLHKKIADIGGQMFIHPGFTNFSWNPHNLASFKVFRRLDTLTKRAHIDFGRKLARKLFA